MENDSINIKMAQITITLSGTFEQETVEKYADFLGYTDMLPTPIPEPNPLTKVEFVQQYVKKVFTDMLAQMQIEEAKAQAENTYKETVEGVKAAIENQITTEIK